MTEHVPLEIVLAMDEGLDTAAIAQRTGIRFCALEGTSGWRETFSDQALDELAPAFRAQLLASLEAEPQHEWIALSPVPGECLARFCGERGIPCSVLPWERHVWFGSKANLHAAVAELDLPRLAGRWVELNGARYSELAREFGARFVMQGEHGADGNSTAVVHNAETFAIAAGKFAGGAVWVAPYAGALSLNVNAIATPAGTAVAYPSVQITGKRELGSSQAGHCGNDFSATAALTGELLESVRLQTSRLGSWMAARGYRGLFGLDFVVDERSGRLCVVDINPRWQGSTSLQSQAACRKALAPVSAIEAAYMAGVLEAAEVMALSDSLYEPVEGAQFFLKAKGAGWWRVCRGLEPGIYTRDLTFIRPALELKETTSPDEILINGHNPRPGGRICGGARLLRVCSTERMVDPVTGKFEDWVCDVIRRLGDALGLEQCPEA
ncbi:MAG TPA: ATP-grasp domain-containing protein [Bryobacteraceae bacterium]|nr:ATP-grasp domain-containing protein [Bryobacteraceae bacterium]